MIEAVVESSWTGSGNDILARACEQYGGIDAWNALSKITLLPGRLSGLLPWVKGVGKTFPLPTAFEISPHLGLTRFVGYPDPEHAGVFENGAVRIERLADRQQFHFDRQGMLVRHDYQAEIVGFWARGAHYWNQQARFNGFPISLDRHVFAKAASVALPVTALHATFVDAEVVFERNPERSRQK